MARTHGIEGIEMIRPPDFGRFGLRVGGINSHSFRRTICGAAVPPNLRAISVVSGLIAFTGRLFAVSPLREDLERFHISSAPPKRFTFVFIL